MDNLHWDLLPAYNLVTVKCVRGMGDTHCAVRRNAHKMLMIFGRLRTYRFLSLHQKLQVVCNNVCNDSSDKNTTRHKN